MVIDVNTINDFIKTWHPVKTIVVPVDCEQSSVKIGSVIKNYDTSENKKQIVKLYGDSLKNCQSRKLICNPMVYNDKGGEGKNRVQKISHDLEVVDSRIYLLDKCVKMVTLFLEYYLALSIN